MEQKIQVRIYAASATAPTNAGNYSVTATLAADANFSGATSAPFTFTIGKANAIIVVTPYTVNYNGNPHTATGTATGVETIPANLSSLLNLSGTTHTAVGDYLNDPWTFAGNFNYNTTNGTVHDNIGTAPLTIKAKDQSKCFGATFVFTGTEFTVTGLLNGDQVTSVTLTSAGAGSSAPTGNYDIVPSAAVGSGLGNYTIQYQNGTLDCKSNTECRNDQWSDLSLRGLNDQPEHKRNKRYMVKWQHVSRYS